MPTVLHPYGPDAEAPYKKALRAGAESQQKPTYQDYGDLEAGVKDPAGNEWYIATHVGEKSRKTKRASKKPPTNYIPAGLRPLNPYLHPQGTDKVIDFLKRAFGAEEMMRVQPPGDVVHHAKVRIGESPIELGEAHGPYGPNPTLFHLYVDDTDTAYRRAIAEGGVSLSEPKDTPWGTRNAGVQDPGGN